MTMTSITRRKTWSTCSAALCGLVLLTTLTACKGKTKPVPAKTAAGALDPSMILVEVHGEKLTAGELDAQVRRAVAMRGGANLPPEQLARVRAQLLGMFVTRAVLGEEAKQQNIEVTDEQRSNGIATITGKLPDGMSLEDVLTQRYGMSRETFVADLDKEIRIRNLLEAKAKEAPDPTDEEIKAFFEENRDKLDKPESAHARHILIACPQAAPEAERTEKKTRAESLQKRLVEGEEFAGIAQTHSDCTTKQNGGDLGTFPRGKMVKTFDDAAFSQEINAIGPVIETQYGYHIIQVLERNQPETASLESAKARIEAILKNQRSSRIVKKYVDELKKNADITFATPPVEPVP